MPSRTRRLAGCIFLLLVATVIADERRAPAPKYSESELKGIFFEDVREAIRGERPTLSSLRKSATAIAEIETKKNDGAATGGVWAEMVSPVSLEDEVKRVRLHYDSVITTPGAFSSGGNQEARLDLTVLATLFAVIAEHSEEVRWKKDAAAARDLLAGSALSCKSTSTPVYNEAVTRKADLQDLISGSGLAKGDAKPTNEWSQIADRSPLMEYAEALIDSLQDSARDEDSIKDNVDLVKRNAELIAMVGEVLTQEGMDEADDEDYVKLSRDMIANAQEVVAAIGRGDFGSVRTGVSGIRQKCDACHEQYR